MHSIWEIYIYFDNYLVMKTIKINGNLRQDLGKKANATLRKEGLVPGIIYGGSDNVTFSVKPRDLRDLIYTPDFNVVELDIDGTTNRCILKDIQFHPVTENIVHIDFLRLVEGHSIKLDIPVKCVGVSPGVKLGGKLQQKMRTVKVKTLPENMVDQLTVDISSLELGDSVRVKDIQANENIEIMNPMANPVATVEVPRALRSATSKAEKEE